MSRSGISEYFMIVVEFNGLILSYFFETREQEDKKNLLMRLGCILKPFLNTMPMDIPINSPLESFRP
jgi:hypothetical protein